MESLQSENKTIASFAIERENGPMMHQETSGANLGDKSLGSPHEILMVTEVVTSVRQSAIAWQYQC